MTEAAPVEPAPALRRSPVPFIVLGVAALAAGIANVWGGSNFPSNAPVEQVEAFGFTIDCIVVLIIAVIGTFVAFQPVAVRQTRVLPIVGMALTALALAVVVVFAWIPSLTDLADGYLLHYSTEVFAAFLLAPAWITGLAFCGFAYRRGGEVVGNVLCILGIAFGVVVFGLAAFSAVIYGLGLTT